MVSRINSLPLCQEIISCNDTQNAEVQRWSNRRRLLLMWFWKVMIYSYLWVYYDSWRDLFSGKQLRQCLDCFFHFVWCWNMLENHRLFSKMFSIKWQQLKSYVASTNRGRQTSHKTKRNGAVNNRKNVCVIFCCVYIVNIVRNMGVLLLLTT